MFSVVFLCFGLGMALVLGMYAAIGLCEAPWRRWWRRIAISLGWKQPEPLHFPFYLAMWSASWARILPALRVEQSGMQRASSTDISSAPKSVEKRGEVSTDPPNHDTGA